MEYLLKPLQILSVLIYSPSLQILSVLIHFPPGLRPRPHNWKKTTTQTNYILYRLLPAFTVIYNELNN